MSNFRAVQASGSLSGLRGERGEIGPAGEKGGRGDRGERGDIGPVGPKGDRGDRGERGERGEVGLSGPKGDRGDRGERGIRGEVGYTGSPGERGDPGMTGSQGPQGPPGLSPDCASIHLPRHSYFGLVNFSEITSLPLARLEQFDQQFIVFCRRWNSKDVCVNDQTVRTEFRTFLESYDITYCMPKNSEYHERGHDSQRSLGDRTGDHLGFYVRAYQVGNTDFYNICTWRTIADILQFRGLYDYV